MGTEVHAAKHVNFEDRRRRFDATSKFGGRGGHTLITALPRSYLPKTCSDISVTLPLSDDGSKLPLILYGAAALRKATELEASGVVKSVARNPDCTDVTMTTYLAEPGEDEFTVSRLSAAANTRRYPRGFDGVHMGCSRCGKNRGFCSNWLGRTKVRRHRLRQQFAATFGADGRPDRTDSCGLLADPWDSPEAVDPADITAVDPAGVQPAGAPGTAARQQPGRGEAEPGAAALAGPAPALEREDSWVVVAVPEVLYLEE